MYKSTIEEKEFLKNYDDSMFQKPSVTADVVVFTISDDNELSVLLIKRGGYPYKDCWAIPGGFVGIDESVDDAAKRELFEETNIKNVEPIQFATFGEVNRDPRTRVISVAYMAFIAKSRLNAIAGDDAADTQLFKITYDVDGLTLIGIRNILKESDLAFDHVKILKTAIMRLRNRIAYTMDAFEFLEDDQDFTKGELKQIYDTILNHKKDGGNFSRKFDSQFVKPGFVVDTGKRTNRNSKRGAAIYKRIK